MQIKFYEEDPNLDVSQKMYIDVGTELDEELTKFIDVFVNDEEFILNMEDYLEDEAQNIYKFYIELIDEVNHESLIKRSKNIARVNINLKKFKWVFPDDKNLCIKIGKIQEKEIYINVCQFEEELSTEEKLKIIGIKDKVLNNTYVSPKELKRIEEEKQDEFVLDDDYEDDKKKVNNRNNSNNSNNNSNNSNNVQKGNLTLVNNKIIPKRGGSKYAHFKISE